MTCTWWPRTCCNWVTRQRPNLELDESLIGTSLTMPAVFGRHLNGAQINDMPTCKELIDPSVGEAEAIIKAQLVGDGPHSAPAATASSEPLPCRLPRHGQRLPDRCPTHLVLTQDVDEILHGGIDRLEMRYCRRPSLSPGSRRADGYVLFATRDLRGPLPISPKLAMVTVPSGNLAMISKVPPSAST